MWEQGRRQELKILMNMIDDLASINQGSNFLGKIRACIESAQLLESNDIKGGRKSFVQFLTDEALDEPEAK